MADCFANPPYSVVGLKRKAFWRGKHQSQHLLQTDIQLINVGRKRQFSLPLELAYSGMTDKTRRKQHFSGGLHPERSHK